MRGVYLAAGLANHPGYDILYNDISYIRDIPGNMMDVDLDKFDFIIATPPCNYWSRANYRRDVSKYALETKSLLPGILKKLINCGKPFIVENVRNERLFSKYKLYDFPCFIYIIGRHTYWTNVMFCTDIEQRQDFRSRGYVITYPDMKDKYHQGGFNVHNVIEMWLKTVL